MFRQVDEAIRTQYAEVKERARAAGPLLPGTPGSLISRQIKGRTYLYRAYYVSGSRRVEDYVGAAEDEELARDISDRIEFASWMRERVSQLARLGFQTADRDTARVLLELRNRGVFEAGLVLVGTLAYVARLNDLGLIGASSRTRDIDVARPSHIKLGIQLDLLSTLRATTLAFVEVPGLSPATPATSAKLRGAGGLRFDLPTSGTRLGAPVRVPELNWHAQAIPWYDYLLDETEPGAVLAGGHCIPVRIPRVGRFIWHKLYASRSRRGEPEKAAKDLAQATTLAAGLGDDASAELTVTFRAAPAGLARKLSPGLSGFARELQATAPEVAEAIQSLR